VRQSTPCVVIDLPHAWAPWIRSCLISADDIVIVASPDLASLRNAKNMIELVRHARPNDTPPRLVINQANMPKRPETPAKDFAETMGVEPSAILAFDAALFGQAGNNGQMLLEIAPKAAVSESLRRLARTLTGREAAAATTDKSPASILSFLKSRKQA
jgi:pilus assembly protein CpaE